MKSILFKSFHLTPTHYTSLSSKLKDFIYSSENGEGVQVVEERSDYIKCIYCYEAISSQNTYNPTLEEFCKIEIRRIELVPFIIDLKYNTLDIIGSKPKCSKVVEMIGRLTNFKIAISDIQVNPIKILLACAESRIPYYVSRVKLKDYIFFDNIIGDCVLNLSNYDKTDELLSKYEEQIIKFTAVLTLDDTYSITFSKHGTITLHKDLEDVDIELIRILKSGL